MFSISGIVKHIYLLLWITGNGKIFSEACLKGPYRRTITIIQYEDQCNEHQQNLEKGSSSMDGNITRIDPKIYTESPKISKQTTISKATEGKPPELSFDDNVNLNPMDQLDCDKNITLQNLSTSNWQTPNYPQPYPEGIHCKLRIGYPNPHQKGFAILSIEVPSMIFTTDDVLCPGDRLTIERLPDGHVEAFCGNLSGKTIILDVNLLRTITFSTTPNDGGTDIGFRVSIKGFLLG
ncbi:uncharacterized protein [Palaemon carinicauda]|uniref:uncharacterized protein n=1 Tax=Palaemon carinicauda TaxID=392227 RepID=UPI0035B6A8C5